MTTLFDVLSGIGRVAWAPVWVPLLTWTALALPLALLLQWTDRLSALAEYRLAQGLLGTLPLGLLAAAGMKAGDAALPSASIGVTTLLPAVDVLGAGESSPASGWALPTVGLVTLIAAGTGLGGLARLLLDLAATARLRTRAGTDAPGRVQVMATRIARRVGVRRAVRVCLSPAAAVPATLGGRHPLLLLPPALVESPEALRLTVLHECVHVRRYDDLAQLLERGVAALFAAHPLVGRLRRRIGEARERACDAAVLALDDAERADYARLLAAFADGPPSRLGALSLSESPSALIHRLDALRAPMASPLSLPSGLRLALLGAGLALSVAVGGLSGSVTAANAPTSASGPAPATPLDARPQIDGGLSALRQAVSAPDVVRMAGVDGTVRVTVTVDRTGSLTAAQVTSGVHEALDAAALRAVRRLSYRPGRRDGRAVRARLTLPITFRTPSAGSGG